jgi:hypothetical protein
MYVVCNLKDEATGQIILDLVNWPNIYGPLGKHGASFFSFNGENPKPLVVPKCN